jgi:hypothetical protein
MPMAKRKKKRELSMRKIMEILRLGLTRSLSNREIARSLCVSHATVARYITLADKAGLTYDKAQNMDDSVLLSFLEKYKEPLRKKVYPEPDWNYLYAELRKALPWSFCGRNIKTSIPMVINIPSSANTTVAGRRN